MVQRYKLAAEFLHVHHFLDILHQVTAHLHHPQEALTNFKVHLDIFRQLLSLVHPFHIPPIKLSMRSSAVIAAIVGATMTVATAIPLSERQLPLCQGTNSNAVCCATDVLGLADLDCAPRKSFLGNLTILESFKSNIACTLKTNNHVLTHELPYLG